ncbi:MAG: AmmeMemoRadiSam system protein B [Candidatus Falkowbacteria bacterium]
MSLVHASVVPHPPLLIPAIGKENLSRLAATAESYRLLSKKLADDNIDTIVIISPHGIIQSNVFTMNLNPQFSCNFKDFGDFATKKTWNGNIALTHRIRESLETKAPLQLISAEELDHGASVPLYLLTEKLPAVKIIPIYYSGLSNEAHFQFGELLKREFLVNRDRVAVIASGDLSHRLTKDAPAGYSPKGKKFDQKIQECLLKNRFRDIVEIDRHLTMDAGECGLKSILILLGILDGIKHEPKLLSYEYPFGVGYLAIDFEL